MHRKSFWVALAVLVLSAGRVDAQVFTPTYMAPRQSSDLGIYLSDGPGDFAVEGVWRRSFGGYDLGLRGGVADTEDPSLLIGGELRHPIGAGAPLDFAVTGSAQGLIGEVSGFGVLVGLSLGHTFGADDFALTPYVHPRAGLVDGFGGQDAELELLADFGVDLMLSPRLDLRFAVGIDSGPTEWGVGFAWR